MKKKRRGSRLFPGQEGECIKVKPFTLEEDNSHNENGNKKMTMKEETGSPEMQEENMSPCLTRKKTSKTAVLSTPTKKPVRSLEIEMAAKKEEPFREMQLRKNIFA